MTSPPEPPVPAEGQAHRRASTLAWLTDRVGVPMVEYLLNCEAAAVEGMTRRERWPSQQQGEVLDVVASIRQSLPNELDQASERQVIAGWLTSSNVGQQLPARAFHAHVGGEVTSVSTADDMERCLVQLADEVYSAFLLEDEFPPELYAIQGRTSIYAIRAIFSHPEARRFLDSVHDDAILGPFFGVVQEHTGRMSHTVYRSIGIASSIQLGLLPDLLLGRAWNGIVNAKPGPKLLAEAALVELRRLKRLIKTKEGTTTARIAFTGILLPPGAQLSVGDGMVREVSQHDRRFAPPGLEGSLSGTDSTGAKTTVNYDGDVLLELSIPLRIHVQPEDSDSVRPWPDSMRLPQQVAATIDRTRFALMLAMKREVRAHLIPTWQQYDDPFSTVGSISWSDPRNGPGIMPFKLTDAEFATWGEWWQRLSRPSVRKIDLAIARILRAAAERRDPSDVLIDSVIAWENLFGTKEGEPTFRISACLAVLLETGLDARELLRAKLSRIYALRSKVVHGSAHLKPSDYSLCYEALEVAINAVRILVQQRKDVLDLPDGAQRSARLLLGGYVAQPD